MAENKLPTEVDGRKVIATEQVETGLSRPGKPVYFTRVVRLLLDDGTEWYACTECGAVQEQSGQVRAHLAREHRADDETDWRQVTLGSAVSAVRAHERLLAEMNEWKRRAQAAERELDTIRRALAPVVKP